MTWRSWLWAGLVRREGGSEFDGCRFSALIDLGELVFGGGDADLKAFDFAEPRSPLRRVGGAVEGGPVGLKCSFSEQPPEHPRRQGDASQDQLLLGGCGVLKNEANEHERHPHVHLGQEGRPALNTLRPLVGVDVLIDEGNYVALLVL